MALLHPHPAGPHHEAAVARRLGRLLPLVAILPMVVGCGAPRESRGGARQGQPPASTMASRDGPAAAADDGASSLPGDTAPIHFADVTAATGIGFVHTDGSGGRRYLVEPLSAGVASFDYDDDGLIDLYFANGAPLDPPPAGDENPPRHALYRTLGDWTFRDESLAAGIDCRAYGLGVVAGDVDDDGDGDLVVTTFGPKILYRNLGDGTFRDDTAAAGDADNDGRIDLFVTDFQPDLPVLFRNLGGGVFEDATAETGAGSGAWQYVTWGTALADFDNDGFRDLFLACGHLNDNVESFDDTTTYRDHNLLLRNVGGRFVDVSAAAGLREGPRHSARGVACDDLDGDGDLDLVILNSREAPTLLRNLDRERGGRHHWSQLRLRGRRSNRDGVGAKVPLFAGDLTTVDEVHAGRGYQGHFGTRLHFGLGPRDRIEAVEVRWPGGRRERFMGLEVDRLETLVEGSGEAIGER